MRIYGRAFAVALPVCTLLGAAASAQSFTTLYSFSGADGANPGSALTFHKGILYSTTQAGGSENCGTVFSLNPASGTETVLHSFLANTDGLTPLGALVYQEGQLFGTTFNGGEGGYGTVFELDPKSGAETVIHWFGSSQDDGRSPAGGLIYQAGLLYGTTEYSGAGYGTVFAVDAVTQTETVLHTFGRQKGGSNPFGGLMYNDGLMYGTTYTGGKKNAGGVFTFNPTSGQEATLYDFTAGGADGERARSALIYHEGFVYGTTLVGGATGLGTVFKVNAITGAEKVLYNFAGGADGVWPYAGVIYLRGVLYGTTFGGAGNGCDNAGCGVVFALNLKTGSESILHSFTGGADGGSPVAPLTYAGGMFYGTTQVGGGTGCGGNGCGTVFRIVP